VILADESGVSPLGGVGETERYNQISIRLASFCPANDNINRDQYLNDSRVLMTEWMLLKHRCERAITGRVALCFTFTESDKHHHRTEAIECSDGYTVETAHY